MEARKGISVLSWLYSFEDEACVGSSPLAFLMDGQSYFVFWLLRGKMSPGIATLIKPRTLMRRRGVIEQAQYEP